MRLSEPDGRARRRWRTRRRPCLSLTPVLLCCPSPSGRWSELDQAPRMARTIVNALARAGLPAIAIRSAEPSAEGARARGSASPHRSPRSNRPEPAPGRGPRRTGTAGSPGTSAPKGVSNHVRTASQCAHAPRRLRDAPRWTTAQEHPGETPRAHAAAAPAAGRRRPRAECSTRRRTRGCPSPRSC